jgi:hypothetical protein
MRQELLNHPHRPAQVDIDLPRYILQIAGSIQIQIAQFTEEQIAKAKAYAASTPPENLDPRIAALVNDLIGRVADKWTMLILEVLADRRSRGSCGGW